jgi:hypothetical protein
MLKAGPDARDHGHLDQLSIQLFARGARLTSDLGTPGYGIGLNDTWYRQTASHSTVLLDGRSQPFAAGRIEHFRASDDFALAGGAVDWVGGGYAGVRMRRAILWRDAYFIDLFHVTCPGPREIDWLYHNLGAPVECPASDPAGDGLAGDCGYAHIAGVRRLRGEGGARLRWQAGQALLDLHLPPADEEVFTGRAPANPASETLSVVVRRRLAPEALFLAVFVPLMVGEEPVVRGIRWPRGPRAGAPGEFVVETARTTERWALGPELAEARLTVSRRPPGASD